jgi:YtoQ family protein
MKYKVYLSGEIHSDWRDEIVLLSESLKLDVDFYNPVTDHQLSDDCGVKIMGAETDKFWHDMKGAGVNAIRTKTLIKNSDIVVVKFGEKYKQWNAAFDAGIASALDKPLIIIHQDEHQHALKEVDRAALAVVKTNEEVVKILNYVINSSI